MHAMYSARNPRYVGCPQPVPALAGRPGQGIILTMRIAVVGTGMVGRTLGAGLARVGHQVVLATRDPEATRSRQEWVDVELPLVRLAEAGDGAEVVVNATVGTGSLPALQAVGGDALAGKVVLDVSNPLDFSTGFPPSLFVANTDSLAEQLQRAFPQARIVKAFNTVGAPVMVDPSIVGGETTLMVAGNDPDAKATVAGLATELGWRDILDLGDLTAARALEMYMPLWLRLFRTAGTVLLNVKVVRAATG
jgi:8-hydroxy-5-deazaflavin:NADPH oxidoreductase